MPPVQESNFRLFSPKIFKEPDLTKKVKSKLQMVEKMFGIRMWRLWLFGFEFVCMHASMAIFLGFRS